MTQTKTTTRTDHKHVPGYMGVCQRCGLEKSAHVREAPVAPTQKSVAGQIEAIHALREKWQRELPKGNVSARSCFSYIEEFLHDLDSLLETPQ